VFLANRSEYYIGISPDYKDLSPFEVTETMNAVLIGYALWCIKVLDIF